LVHMPLQPGLPKIAPGRGSTLAKKTAQLVMEPELRLRLRAMTLSEIVKLKRGDILSVMQGTTSAVAHLAVRGNSILTCELGQIGGRYSARVIGSASASTNTNAASMARGGN
jgi:flagellar motor switch protein FliM